MVGCNKLNQKGWKRLAIDKQKPYGKPGTDNESALHFNVLLI